MKNNLTNYYSQNETAKRKTVWRIIKVDVERETQIRQCLLVQYLRRYPKEKKSTIKYWYKKAHLVPI